SRTRTRTRTIGSGSRAGADHADADQHAPAAGRELCAGGGVEGVRQADPASTADHAQISGWRARRALDGAAGVVAAFVPVRAPLADAAGLVLDAERPGACLRRADRLRAAEADVQVEDGARAVRRLAAPRIAAAVRAAGGILPLRLRG